MLHQVRSYFKISSEDGMLDFLLKIRKKWITCSWLQSVWVTQEKQDMDFLDVPLCFAHKPLISTRSFFICLDKQGQGESLATFGCLAQELLFFLLQRAPGQDLCTWNLNTNLQVLWFRFHRPVLLPKYVFPARPADRLGAAPACLQESLPQITGV